jgi:hypothetical protein
VAAPWQPSVGFRRGALLATVLVVLGTDEVDQRFERLRALFRQLAVAWPLVGLPAALGGGSCYSPCLPPDGVYLIRQPDDATRALIEACQDPARQDCIPLCEHLDRHRRDALDQDFWNLDIELATPVDRFVCACKSGRSWRVIALRRALYERAPVCIGPRTDGQREAGVCIH